MTSASHSSNRASSSVTVCKDLSTACPQYKSWGYCRTFPDYMGQSCMLTCGKCPECKDLNSNCPGWLQYCSRSSIYWPYMSRNCKKTCKICTDGSGGGSGGGGGGGGGGGSGGGGSGKKEFTCDFESGFCDWANQPIDDAANWAIGVASGGPSSGAKGSASYAYVDSTSNSYNAKLILPWELVLPLDKTSIGTMCLHLSFQTGSGSLKVIENVYPTASNKNPQQNVKATLQGSGTWVDGTVLVEVDDKRQLTLEGVVGGSGRVAIDNIAFVKGRC